MRRNMLFLRGSMACGQALCLWCDHLLVQLSAQELHFYDQCTNIYLQDFGLVIVTRFHQTKPFIWTLFVLNMTFKELSLYYLVSFYFTQFGVF